MSACMLIALKTLRRKARKKRGQRGREGGREREKKSSLLKTEWQR